MSFTVFGFHVTGAVIVLGLVTGMVYGILAVGLVLVYRSSRIINFAHGEIGAFGAALLGVATLGLGQIISTFSTLVDASVGSGITYPQPSGFPHFGVGALLMTPAYSAMLIVTPVIVVVLA